MGILDGKVAIVTGGSRGIGAEIALRFSEVGAAVAVAARSAGPGVSPLPGTIIETVDRIRAAGGTAVPIQIDLSHPEDRERLVAETIAELGTPDILVNNGAVTYFSPVADFRESRYDIMYEVQVKAAFQLAQLVIPGMKSKGEGWILNISSGAARHPTLPPAGRAGAGGTVYGMVKASLERFSSGLAAELWDDNISVNALSPNKAVPTPGTIYHQLTTEDDPNNEPREVFAEAALMLCSAKPKTLTGRIAYSMDLLTELGIPFPVRRQPLSQ